MKLLLSIILLLPLFALAQTKPFAAAEIGVEYNKELKAAPHGQVSAGAKFSNRFYTGAGIGITKFTRAEGMAFVPVFAKFMFVDNKKTGLTIVLEPGYMLNKNGVEVQGSLSGNRKEKVNRGPYYHIAAGLKLIKAGKYAPMITAGYTAYDFNKWQENSSGTWFVKPKNYGAFSVRVAVAL